LCAVHTILSYCDEAADVLKQVACQFFILIACAWSSGVYA
jgi:hypothetical protein